MNIIEIADIKKLLKEEKSNIFKSINKVLTSGKLILSKDNLDIEKKISRFIKTKYCLTLNSGTDALMMSLWSSGIKKGDEVITTTTSFVATVNSIMHVGAKPVFVDIDETLNIDPDLIEKSITKKTKAILVVHWTGRICDMEKITKIAKKKNLIIIEDAAQAMGAYYKGKHAGTFGQISAFSLHPFKNLSGLGDGGFIVTNKKKLHDKIKIYRNHGINGPENVEFAGVNSRLDSIHASIVNFRLKKLNSIIKKKNNNINLYKKFLKTDQLKIIENKKNEKSSISVFIALCSNRDKLQNYLKKFKIETAVYYRTPLYLYKSTKYLGYTKKDFPKTNFLNKQIISLPIHQFLKIKDIKYICDKINNFYLLK